ncbi:MAG: ATP-binding protein [Luminiphilus sp.]|nr:ATP-binding protein [Luminiphilus sp.]
MSDGVGVKGWLTGAGLCAGSLVLAYLPAPGMGQLVAPIYAAPLILMSRLLPAKMVLVLMLITAVLLYFFVTGHFFGPVWSSILFLLFIAVDFVSLQFARRRDLLSIDLAAALLLCCTALLVSRMSATDDPAVVAYQVANFGLGAMISAVMVAFLGMPGMPQVTRGQLGGETKATRSSLTQIIELSTFTAVLLALCVGLWVVDAQAAPVLVVSNLLLACMVLVLTRAVFHGYIAPMRHLAQKFEQWRALSAREGGRGAVLQAVLPEDLSGVKDICDLQESFSVLTRDIINGERRLSTIAANYDELLRSLPLGVLAIDAGSEVQFLNDALSEITNHRQDALASLHEKAANMLAEQSMVGEWQLVLPGVPPKSLLLVVTHRLDERGQGSGLWAIVTDITEQKHTNAQLIQAAKLATLGEMSTGMAHELNQPLNVISLAASNLRFSLNKADSKVATASIAKIERIEGAVRRAANIIDHMRAYGRLSGEGLAPVELGQVVAGACNLISEQLKLANVRLNNHFPANGGTIMGNSIQLEQVLINLINNAKDAITANADAGEVLLDAEFTDSRVLLRVSDDGGGIPEDVLPHIFEPFFTTKPVGKGTGLGGSISYGIIRDMQGDIWAENLPQGARITVSLPLLQSKSQIAKQERLAMNGLDP